MICESVAKILTLNQGLKYKFKRQLMDLYALATFIDAAFIAIFWVDSYKFNRFVWKSFS